MSHPAGVSVIETMVSVIQALEQEMANTPPGSGPTRPPGSLVRACPQKRILFHIGISFEVGVCCST